MLSILLFLALQTNAQTLAAIEFEGNKKTKTSYLERFVKCKVGQSFDSLLVRQDIQVLKNLNLFYEVKTSLTGKEAEKTLTFHLKEVFTLLPIVNFGGIKDNFWLQLGAADNNFIGKGITLGGYYRYYDRHSAFAYVKIPYIKGTNWGISASFLKWSTREPIHLDSISTLYNYDNYSPEILPRYSFRQGHYLEAGGAFLYERYSALEPQETMGLPVKLKTNKFLLKAVHHIENLRYNFHYLAGFSNELRLETVYTPIYEGIFWKLQNETRYFKRIGKTANLAWRLRVGIADNGATPFPPFVLDSYVNIRGVGNRVLRGTGELVLNTEYRQTVVEKKFGAIQGVAFVDIGALRETTAPLSSLKNTTMAFGGLGLRLYLRRFYNFILRADYAIDLAGSRKRGFVLGVGQYF